MASRRFFSRPVRTPCRNKRERGAFMAEAAVSVGLLFFIIFAFSELGVFLYRQLTLQYLVNDTARWASLGEVTEIRNSISFRHYTADQVKDHLRLAAGKYNIGISVNDIHLCPVTDPTCTTSIPLQKDAIFSLRVTRNFPLIFRYRIPISVHAVGRVE